MVGSGFCIFECVKLMSWFVNTDDGYAMKSGKNKMKSH